MKFKNSKDSLNWMLNHPFEKLYADEWDSYLICKPYTNTIEYHYYEDEEEKIDFYSFNEFLKKYNNKLLSDTPSDFWIW